MPAKNSQRINKDKFKAVIKSAGLNADVRHLAELHQISVSTVKAIRQAKTWDEYERRKAVKASKVAQAASAKRALNPAPRPVAKKAVAPGQATQGVVNKAPSTDSEYMTRLEVNKEIQAAVRLMSRNSSTRLVGVHDRLKAIEKRFVAVDEAGADHMAIIGKARAERAPFPVRVWKRVFGKAGK
ncbi:hypothetical protein [Rhodococcus ruber]|uniref:hypothetical protein n=1 Tax=Rhodococcus ruber TaxID=1830 RepID=UPI001F1978B2|nr:hypothetical protein [Rhodococcus ruber]MCF8783232.1 hypothetical protein [Rhodococcus ruber]